MTKSITDTLNHIRIHNPALSHDSSATPISTASPDQPCTPSPFRSPIALPSYHLNPTHDSIAEVRSLAVLQEAVKTYANLALVRRWRGLEEPTAVVADGAESVHLLHGRDDGPSPGAALPPPGRAS